MAEEHNYQLLTAIIKIVRPKNSPVLGIADGAGKFMWLPTEQIIVSHPNQFDVWQTTIFAISPDWKIIWKDEQNWEQYKHTYSNTKAIKMPIPPMFTELQPQLSSKNPIATSSINQPIAQTTSTQPANYQQPSTTIAPPNVHQPSQTVPQQSSVTNTPANDNVGTDVNIERIANELTSIRKLLELFIKPPQLITADEFMAENKQEKTMEQITEEFGAPPDDTFINKLEPKANKGKLPNIF